MLQERREGTPSPTGDALRCSYYVITRRPDGSGRPTYRVWRRTTGNRQARLIGDYTHLDEARASLPIDWRTGSSDGIVAWALVRG